MALTENRVRDELQRLYRDSATKERDPLAELAAATRMIEILEGYQLALMERSRADSAAWAEIGEAKGCTGQAAGRWFTEHRGRDRHPSVLKRAERDRRWAFGDDDQ